MKHVIEFEQDNISIEVNGKEYEIPKRTEAIESKIHDFDRTRDTRSDLDNYKLIFEILFGKTASKELTAKGKDENLDLLNKIYLKSIELYYIEKTKAEEERIEETIEKLQPLMKDVGKISALQKVVN